MAMQSRGFVRSRDKTKIFYLQCYNAHDHRAWQDDDLPLPRKSHEHIITWSCTYPLTPYLWLSLLARWEYIMKTFLP